LIKSPASGTIQSKMSLTRTLYKPYTQETTKVIKRERCFEISLPTTVKGVNTGGDEFEEQTEITSISSLHVAFWLKSKVIIGSQLNVCLEIPKTLILENHLKLLVSGKVSLVQADVKNKNGQLVSIQLDKAYKIQPSSIKT